MKNSSFYFTKNMSRRFIANESDVTSNIITEYYHCFGIVKNEIFKVKDDEHTFQNKENAWLYLLFKRFFNDSQIKIDIPLLEGECVDVYNEEKKIACYLYSEATEASINETKEKFRLIGIDCIFMLKSLSFTDMKKKVKNEILNILILREQSERSKRPRESLKRKLEYTEAIDKSDDLIFSQATEASEGSTYSNGDYKNRCIICKEDLGITNPRQYCRKSYCPYEGREYKIRERK